MAKEIKLTKGQFAIVDDEDYDYLNQWKWCLTTSNYVRRWQKGKTIYLHRVILKVIDKNIFVDHIDMNTLDNRKINLRICTRSQNAMNRNKTIKNTTGYKGVIFQPNRNKYYAKIKLNSKIIFLGHYIDPIDAARAYNAAALKYHGEFANLNKID
jgi:hypothetical protein